MGRNRPEEMADARRRTLRMVRFVAEKHDLSQADLAAEWAVARRAVERMLDEDETRSIPFHAALVGPRAIRKALGEMIAETLGERLVADEPAEVKVSDVVGAAAAAMREGAEAATAALSSLPGGVTAGEAATCEREIDEAINKLHELRAAVRVHAGVVELARSKR